MSIDDAENLIGIAQASVTTLATLLTIGIAFLARPGRATLYWSLSFTLAMAATFTTVAGEALDDETVRRIGLGALMGAPALLWSGFRSQWNLRPYGWTGAAVAVIGATTLALVTDPSLYATAYRLVFFLSASFAALLVVDWVRCGARRRDLLLLPLAVASLAFWVLASGAILVSVLSPSTSDDLQFLRMVSSVGMIVYTSAALYAVIRMSTQTIRKARRSAALGDWVLFQDTARRRLGEAIPGESWSLIYLRLDDVAEIRRAAGSGVLATLNARFVGEVRAVFDGVAEVDSPSAGTAVVVTQKNDLSVREAIRTLLDRISAIDVDGRLPIHLSASVGWAPSSVVGYELDALFYMGREAAILATENGGDRWERVGTTVTQRVLNVSVQQ